MPSCVLCGRKADHLLVYELIVNRVEVLCEDHLGSVRDDMPESSHEGKVKVHVEAITRDSLFPGPRTTRFPPEPKL